jgi:hypothetical protein
VGGKKFLGDSESLSSPVGIAWIIDFAFFPQKQLVTRVSEDGAHFREVAENLAVAPTPGAVEDEWMYSPPHRRNILDAHLNEIGIGLVRQGHNLWAVEDFSAGVAALGSSQIERQIAQLLSQRDYDRRVT